MKKKLFNTVLVVIFVCCIFGFYFYNRHKETIVIIGAMDEEISEIRNNLHHSRTDQKLDYAVTTGTLGNNKIILAKSGVGKVASSATTQFLIDKYKPAYIINIGIAGSLSTDIKPSDIVIGKNMVQHDFDVTAFGNPKGYIDNGIEPNKPTVFHSDKNLIKNFNKKVNYDKDTNVILGTIATGDVFVNKETQKQKIRNEFGADAIDMESAAIAQTAQKNNVPLIVIRTISDSENNSTSEYEKNKKTSSKKSALIIQSILNNNYR